MRFFEYRHSQKESVGATTQHRGVVFATDEEEACELILEKYGGIGEIDTLFEAPIIEIESWTKCTILD